MKLAINLFKDDHIQHYFLINLYQQISYMFRKCFGCIHKIGQRFFGEQIPRWQQHLDNYCLSNSQRYVWCQMLLDNFELIRSHGCLSKQLQHEIRNTNISSEIVKIIQIHYTKEQNVFQFCIQLFGSYLKLKYSQVINPSKNTFNKLLKDYQQFMTLLIDLIVIYYKLEDRQILGENLFYNYTLPCLIVSFLFQCEDVSATIHHITKLVYKQSIEKIQFNLQKYFSMKIEDFQIKQQLQLNEKTLKNQSIKGQLGDERPYSGAIQIIKQVIRVNNPAQKMNLIDGIQKQIQSTIYCFYKKYGIKSTEVEVDYENMISILLYIILQVNQSNLYSHLQIIIHFGPKKKSKTNDCSLEYLNTVFEMIQRGNISKQNREYLEFSNSLKNIEVKSYFDEVSSFDL